MPEISEREVVRGLRVRHRKRGTVYWVVGTSTFQGKEAYDNEVVVTYADWRDGTRWTRPLAEFCDGRFEQAG